ncbi:MAG TPA: glycosyltransferase family 1 protein [Chloroflexia bacterium]|nr:glycosyltransferase family 1 protein [Chloroflexia bacterium]
MAFDARMVHYRRAGGIGQYSVSLLRALSRLPEVGRGARVQVLQMRGDSARIVRDRRFRRVPVWTPPHHRFEQPALGVELLKLWPRPQLVHSPDFVPPRYRTMRAVANIQDLAFLKFPGLTLLTDESKRYYGQVHRAAQDADALIALSHSARDDIESLLGVKPEKVAVIPAAAGEQFKPPDDFRHAQELTAREFGLPAPDEGGYVLFVGTIEPRKNLPTLLEAYRVLLDAGRVSPAPALAVAGREGWLFEQVHARIDELRLSGHVRLLGGVSDAALVRLYQGAQAFAMPSLYEGFGLPVLEAMRSGVPVVSSNAGSLAEVAGDAAILVEPQDVDGWAAGLERVLLDEGEAARLVAAGLRQAGRFSWERAARETWDLYGRVVSG